MSPKSQMFTQSILSLKSSKKEENQLRYLEPDFNSKGLFRKCQCLSPTHSVCVCVCSSTHVRVCTHDCVGYVCVWGGNIDKTTFL